MLLAQAVRGGMHARGAVPKGGRSAGFQRGGLYSFGRSINQTALIHHHAIAYQTIPDSICIYGALAKVPELPIATTSTDRMAVGGGGSAAFVL